MVVTHAVFVDAVDCVLWEETTECVRDEVGNEGGDVGFPFVELLVGVPVGLASGEFERFTGGCGFTESEGVEKEAVRTVAEDTTAGPSVTDRLLAELEVGVEGIAKHGGGFVIHYHELVVVGYESVETADPVDVEAADVETGAGLIAFPFTLTIVIRVLRIVVITEKELGGVGDYVVNVDMTDFDFERAFDERTAFVVEDLDRGIVLVVGVVFLETGYGVRVGAPTEWARVIEEVLDATLLGDEETLGVETVSVEGLESFVDSTAEDESVGAVGSAAVEDVVLGGSRTDLELGESGVVDPEDVGVGFGGVRDEDGDWFGGGGVRDGEGDRE